MSTTTATAEASSTAPQRRVLGPEDGSQWEDLKELWHARELLWILAERDIKVRYRQAIIGVAWVLIQPLLTILLFFLFFKLWGRQPAAGEHSYLLSGFLGMSLWQFCETSIRDGTMSLLMNRALLTKVYFPRLCLPLAVVTCALFDLLVTLGGFVVLMLCMQVVPSWNVVFFPLFLLLGVGVAAGGAIWFSALHALYRDVGHTVPFLMRLGFFASPVVYESSRLVPDKWRWLYDLNPLVAMLDGVRWAVLDGPAPRWSSVLISTIIISIFLATGRIFFHKVEMRVADTM